MIFTHYFTIIVVFIIGFIGGWLIGYTHEEKK